MKYCTSCGCQIKDEAQFCPKCGAQQAPRKQQREVEQGEGMRGSVQQASAMQTNNSVTQLAGNLKSKFLSDKRYRIAGIGVLLLILIAIIFKSCSSAGSRTMEGAVEAYYEAIADKDGEDYLDITISDSLMEAVLEKADYTKKEMVEEMESTIESKYKDCGKVKDIKVRDIQAAGKAQVSELVESMKKESGVDVKISEMHQVEASFQYFDTDDKEWEKEEEELLVYKSGSRWFVLPSWIF